MTLSSKFGLVAALVIGVLAVGSPANASRVCPPDWEIYHGSCRGPEGQTTLHRHHHDQNGFYRVDRDWGQPGRSLDLPELPPGQHYKFLNGRFVRMNDNGSYSGARALQDILNNLLR